MDAFPAPVGELLPHALPMLCIDSLVNVSSESAEVLVHLGPDHILLRDGLLSEVGYVELAAQAAGAMKGYAEKLLGLPVREGFLVAVQDFSIFSRARQGQTLRISLSRLAEMSGVNLLETTIRPDSPGTSQDPLAWGKLKVFVPEPSMTPGQ
ncbi:MAG: hypothetical protein LBP38_04580 [Desulfovibrio sp.]|jgi:predicted hotdog family 3-hydroxylacyl-ACP dehydratase|nr:hypothetical protein [Desulfovibrio sp.]